MSYFFVTGLPRSRTAWLANFFTHGTAYCHHEATSEVDDLFEFFSKMRRTPGERKGNSDSAMLFIHDEVRSAFPGARTVLIRRDRKEVNDSMLRAFGEALPEELLRDADERLDRIGAHSDTLTIPFPSLGDLDCLRKAWGWVCDAPFPHERAEMLNKMNVTVETEKFLKGNARAPHFAFDHAARRRR